jgi:hypothetical protein
MSGALITKLSRMAVSGLHGYFIYWVIAAGILGKRTRYQQHDLAQLVVQFTLDDSNADLVDNNVDYLEEFKRNSLQMVCSHLLIVR